MHKQMKNNINLATHKTGKQANNEKLRQIYGTITNIRHVNAISWIDCEICKCIHETNLPQTKIKVSGLFSFKTRRKLVKYTTKIFIKLILLILCGQFT